MMQANQFANEEMKSPADKEMHPAMSGADTLAALTRAGTMALREALVVYLAIGETLAADAFEGVPAQARVLADALSRLSESNVAGRPHFWHERATLLATLAHSAGAMAGADDVASARQAFGRLSVAFAELVASTGTPSDLQVRRFTCGMYREAPEGGVWLQQGDEARNPYFGSAMRQCHRSQSPVPARPAAEQPVSNKPTGHTEHH